MNNDATTRDKKLQMQAAYQRLIKNRVTDIAQWQAVHRILPDVAHFCLKVAMLQCEWDGAVQLVLAFTQSPAMLATGLGCRSYDERTQTVVFTESSACQLFRAQFPDWRVVQEMPGEFLPNGKSLAVFTKNEALTILGILRAQSYSADGRRVRELVQSCRPGYLGDVVFVDEGSFTWANLGVNFVVMLSDGVWTANWEDQIFQS